MMNATPIDIQFFAAGIANAKATAVLEDEHNGFYIATSGSGVSYFQPDLHRWQTFTEVDGLANPDIRAMLKTRRNRIWFGTADGSSCYCPATRTWTSLFVSDGLPDNAVWSLLEDAHQNIWFGTNGGGIAVLANGADLSRLSSEDWTIYNTQNGLTGNNINALHQDQFGNIWAGTTQGVSCYESASQQWVHYLKNTSINAITSDRDNKVWFATNQGLICYYSHDEHWQTFNTQSGLGSDTVQTLSWSETGGLWAGTRNGISKFLGDSNYATGASAFLTLTQADGLTDNMVWGLFQDSRNTLWIATWGGGVSRYTPGQQTWQTYTTPSEFADTYTMSVIKSGTKHVWIGTWGAISRYNLENGEWLTLSSADNLPNNNVQCLAQLRENEVWVGAYGGLIHYNIDTQTWRFYTKDNGLTSNNVTALLANKADKKLYIGTDKGLCCWSESAQSIAAIHGSEFAQKSISAIYSDQTDNLWIATNNGLFQQESRDHWIQYSKDNGLPSQNVTAIAVDSEGTAWVGTDKGLCYRRRGGQQFATIATLTTEVSSIAIADNNVWIADSTGTLYRLNGLSTEQLAINDFGADPLTSLAFDEQGDLWIASQGGGVFWLSLRGKGAGYLQNFTAGAQHFATEFAVNSPWIVTGRPESVAAAQSSNKVAVTIEVAHRPFLSMAQQEENPFVWVGSDEEGLYIEALNSHHVAIAPDKENRINGLPSRHITDLSNPVNQGIWVGTRCGLARVNQQTQKAEKTYSYPAIPSGPVSAIATNPQAQTLVAFNNINPARFQDHTAAARREKTSLWLATSHVEELQLSGEDLSDFENAHVLTIYSVDESNFWLGTDVGLFNLALDNHLITRIDSVPADTSVTRISASPGTQIAVLAFDNRSNKPAVFWSGNALSSPLAAKQLPASLIAISNMAFDNNSDTLYACVGCNVFRLNPQ